MEILYYWIDGYVNIEKQGFNFGGELLFEYDEMEKKLVINENQEYIKDFFCFENYNNINNINIISAIVGKNGSGKTTFINALKGLIIDRGIIKRKYEDVFKRILVYKNDNQIYVIFHNDLILKNTDNSYNIEFKCNKKDNIQFIGYNNNENISSYKDTLIRVNKTEILENVGCIYFSNIFESNFFFYTTMEERQYFDISTKGILHETDKKNYKNSNSLDIQNSNHITNKDKRFGLDFLKEYHHSELKSKIKFLKENEFKKKILFKMPESITLYLDYILFRKEHFNIWDLEEHNFLRYEKDIKNLDKIENYLYAIIKNDDIEGEKDLAKRTFLLRALESFFDDVNRFISDDIIKVGIREKANNIDNIDLYNKSISNIIELYGEIAINLLKGNINKNIAEEIIEIQVSNFKRLVESYRRFIEYTICFFDNDKINFISDAVDTFIKDGGTSNFDYEKVCIPEIKLDTEGIELVNQFLEHYSEIFTESDFVKFVWRNISSGEDALFSMYSRFNNIKDKVNSKFLLVLIDEGEVYFHPEWQRKYINILVEYLPLIFSKCESIQIVVSSNSPFVIADLPKSNIMFLEQSIEKELELNSIIKVVGGINTKQTFANNIHRLLIDNFFLNSTIGEFADRKIKEIIKILKNPNDEDISPEKIEYINKVISIIGEPIIRKRLKELFDKKFNYDDHTLKENKIEQLLLEISKLKKIQEPFDIDNLMEMLKEKIDILRKKDNIND